MDKAYDNGAEGHWRRIRTNGVKGEYGTVHAGTCIVGAPFSARHHTAGTVQHLPSCTAQMSKGVLSKQLALLSSQQSAKAAPAKSKAVRKAIKKKLQQRRKETARAAAQKLKRQQSVQQLVTLSTNQKSTNTLSVMAEVGDGGCTGGCAISDFPSRRAQAVLRCEGPTPLPKGHRHVWSDATPDVTLPCTHGSCRPWQ